LCAIDYRCPSYLVDCRARNFFEWTGARYFLFIACLIARLVSYAAFTAPLDLTHFFSLFLSLSLSLSFFLFLSFSFSLFQRGQAGWNCLHCTDPFDDISHYIKLHAEARVEGYWNEKDGENSSSAGSWARGYTSVRFVLNFTRCFRFPEHLPDISACLAGKFHTRPAKSVE